jgi:hypothetical protein
VYVVRSNYFVIHGVFRWNVSWSKRLGIWVKMTQCLTLVILIQVKEKCLLESLGVVSLNSQLSPENPHSRPDIYRRRDCHAPLVQACIFVDLSTVGERQPWKKAIYQTSCILGHRFLVIKLHQNKEVIIQKANLTKPPGS